jgi:hypothetical protein
MSRKITLSLAVAALTAVALAAGPASAARTANIRGPIHTSVTRHNPRHPFHPRHPGKVTRFHHHHRHRVFRGGRWIVIEEPVVDTVVRGPCTCLTKSYTPDGLVVFADLCTQESASAPVDGSVAQAAETQNPDNYGGRTYQDYLATHPQAAQAQKVPAVQTPDALDAQPKK